MTQLFGRLVVPGKAEAQAIVTEQPISFFGGVNPKNGRVIEKEHELKGQIITGKVLVFPHGKGSTVGSYVLYGMKKNGTAPAAIINIETEPIIAIGCVLGEIPLIDKLNENPVKAIKTGNIVKFFVDRGIIDIKDNVIK